MVTDFCHQGRDTEIHKLPRKLEIVYRHSLETSWGTLSVGTISFLIQPFWGMRFLNFFQKTLAVIEELKKHRSVALGKKPPLCLKELILHEIFALFAQMLFVLKKSGLLSTRSLHYCTRWFCRASARISKGRVYRGKEKGRDIRESKCCWNTDPVQIEISPNSFISALAAHALKTLNAMGIFKNDNIWFPSYYFLNTVWNYSDCSPEFATVSLGGGGLCKITCNSGLSITCFSHHTV
jgi:hypothetical protein